MAITKVIRDFQWNRCHVLEHKVSFQILRDTSNIHTWQNDTIGEANGWLFDSQCLVEGKMPKKKRDYSSCESNFSNCKPLKSRQKVREEKFDEVVSMLEVFFFAVSRHVQLTLEYSACARQWKFSHFLLCFVFTLGPGLHVTCLIYRTAKRKADFVRPQPLSCDYWGFPWRVMGPILGDPGAVSRVRRKGGTKVFKYGWKSPWVPTLIKLFPKIQADAGSWLGTKNFLYYCAQ